MFRKIDAIEDIPLQFGLDAVNCFERSLCILYHYILPKSEKLYLLHEKLMQTLGEVGDIVVTGNYEAYTGVRCIEKETADLTETVIELIDKGHPVLVPGNLIALYYSPFYQEKSSEHLFLIHGYDAKKKLFLMYDYLQLPMVDFMPVYEEFPIRFEDLEEVAANYHPGEAQKIFYLEAQGYDTSFEEKLTALVSSVITEIEAHTYREFILSQYYRQEDGEKMLLDLCYRDPYNFIVNLPKHKEAILTLFEECMDEYSYDSKNLKAIKNGITRLWKKDNATFVKKIVRGNREKIYFEVSDETVELEKQLCEELRSFVKHLN